MSCSKRAIVVWGRLGALLLLALFGCTAPTRGQNGLWAVEDYQGSFQYRYGNPLGGVEQRLVFADPHHDDGGWLSASGLGKLPGRGDAEVLWLRTRLIGPPLANPTLYVRLSGQDLEVFLESRPVAAQEAASTAVDRIASMGDEFLIPLGPDYVGKTLVLRLVSQAPLFGILATPRLGDTASVAFDLVRRNGAQGLVALLFLSLAVVGAVLFGFYRTEYAYLHFALFSFAIGIWNLTFTGMLGILIPWPFPRFPTRALSISMAFGAFSSYIGAVLGLGPLRILRWLRLLWLAVFALFIAVLVTEPRLMFRLIPPVAILAVLTIISWVTTAIREARRGNTDAKLLSLGFMLVLAVMAPGILVVCGIVSGSVGFQFHMGTVVWGLSLAAILLRRFVTANRRTLQLQIERTLSSRRLEEQQALLQAAANMAKGDLEKKIEVEKASSLVPLAVALDGMRQDFQAKLQLLDRIQQDLRAQVDTLETRNQEIGHLNDELRRQIEQRSDRMIEILSRSRPGMHAMPQDKLAADELLGDHYRVVRPLGQGAMGSVYEVERISDGLHLAAKVMATKADRSAMIRFVREARILAQLKHPNLVTIMDIDVALSGDLFLVMELVDGVTLKVAKTRYGEPGFAWTVLRQICFGLQAIHAQGITHRDLKPANVLLAEKPEGLVVKIADFGISTLSNNLSESPARSSSFPALKILSVASTKIANEKTMSGDECKDATADILAGRAGSAATLAPEAAPPSSTASAVDKALAAAEEDLLCSANLTQTGVLLGTPFYMAPELASGSRQAPPASDIFSLGVIAYELLTGKLPFTAPPVFAVWEGKVLAIQRLAELRPDLPKEVAALIERCLSSDSAERPTLTELSAGLP